MKKHITLLLLCLTCHFTHSQHPWNPYRTDPIAAIDLCFYCTNNPPVYSWFNRTDNQTPFSGEYVILLARHPWKFWEATPNFVHVSFSIEVVSFPFVPTCAFDQNGCAGTIGRTLTMPSSPYDPIQSKWGGITNYKFKNDWNQINQALASIAYVSANSLNSQNTTFPHTILKHTINLHCGTHTFNPPFPPILYSQSWIYDNTRGMMKYYPFCPNCAPPCSNESDYDLAFYPEPINFNQMSYLEDPANSTAFLPNGVLNYYPYSELPASANCGIPSLNLPVNTATFSNGPANYFFPYFPPYSLLGSPLWQNEGSEIAGYYTDFTNNQILPRQGILQTHIVDLSIPLTDIAVNERVFYNPSETFVTATDLIFPAHYTFKTVLGVYPSPAQASTDNTAENGGPYSDLRDVPVRTDLRSEDPLFPNSPSVPKDSRYASLYKMQPGSKITIEPCVKIFDAAFILEPGATLKYDNFNTQIGFHPDENISRVAIDRNGGRLIRQYDNTLLNSTLFLQNLTETAMAPNSYIVDEKIEAGENVDPTQQSGPYIASAGTHLELIAKNYVKMADGFRAEAGAEVKIAVDPYMSIPACPPPPPAASAGSRIRNAQQEQEAANFSKVLLSPNPAQEQTLVALTDKDDQIIRLQLHDLKGQLIQTQENILQPSWLLNISHLTDGLYLLSVTTKHQTQVVKLAVNTNP